MIEERRAALLDAQIVVARPTCTAQIMLYRSNNPQIDACGFESYSLECKECGAVLACIIDPVDETPLISRPDVG